jgi:branched-chain amino acid transport system ATP-binding protein
VTAVLDVRDLHAGYNDVPVVRGIDLTVAPGEVVALLGPNGAGKTTTLATISGLLPRLGGEIQVLGEPEPPGRRRGASRRALRLARRGVAHVPEDRGLFFGLTGREHLRLAARRSDRTAVADALGFFPVLAGIADRRAGLLSGGEQQMLAIARALAARPKLMMIDELSLGLAPIVVQTLLPLVRDAARAADIGVVIVEQHVRAALDVADRAYVLVRGEIVLAGAAADLARDPDRITRSYLGGP